MSATKKEIDLATVEGSGFQPHVDSEFTLVREGENSLELTLLEVAGYPDHSAGERRKPFGLIFKCETGGLPQGTYRLEHAECPAIDLFLSPFEGGETWTKLEAIIN